MSSTNGTGTSSTSTSNGQAVLNCHPSVWQRLNAIVDRRKNAKSRERDLVKHRREVEGELEECGSTPSGRRTKLCVDHWDTIKAIEGERTRIQTLADLLEGSIVEGRTGKLYEHPEDLDNEIAAAEAEEEPELVKHARQEREEKKKQASQILKIEGHPSGELIVGRSYRFSSRTDPEIHCLGVVQGFENNGEKIWIEASDFSEKFPEHKRAEDRQPVDPSTVIWVEVKGAGKAKGNGEGKAKEAPAQAGVDKAGTLNTFPGRYIVRSLMVGAGSQCYNAYSAENLMSHCRVAVGAEDGSTVEVKDLGGGVGEILLNGLLVAKVHYAGEIEGHENDPGKKKARKEAAPAQAGKPDPKQNGKKPKEAPVPTPSPAPTAVPAVEHRINGALIEVGKSYRFDLGLGKDKAAGRRWLIGSVVAIDDGDIAEVRVASCSPGLQARNGHPGPGDLFHLDLTACLWKAAEGELEQKPAKKLDEVKDTNGRPKKGKGAKAPAKKAEASA